MYVLKVERLKPLPSSVVGNYKLFIDIFYRVLYPMKCWLDFVILREALQTMVVASLRRHLVGVRSIWQQWQVAWLPCVNR